MIGRTYEARDLRIASAVQARRKLQDFITELWKERGLEWTDDGPIYSKGRNRYEKTQI